ncbi:MAG: DM13 domain-containing protein [Actinomycetota bacterium]
MRRFVGRHRLMVGSAGVVAVALVVFVLVWFQPQKLFLDQRVSEALPTAAAGDAEPAGAPTTEPPSAGETASPKLATLAGGAFQSLEHETTGRAIVLQRADGTRYLRFEDLRTSNGPDLHVYLSEIPASDDWYAYGERFVSLGKLKGNIGDQNYRIPKDLDLSKYKSAVIWCKRFSVGFAVAPLES